MIALNTLELHHNKGIVSEQFGDEVHSIELLKIEEI